MSKQLIQPAGGKLVNLFRNNRDIETTKRESLDWPNWTLTSRQIRDLELLSNGGYSPLEGFLSRKDYESVLDTLHLADGTFWPMPIMLDITEDLATSLKKGDKLALRDTEGAMLAVVTVAETWQPDLDHEAKAIFGTCDQNNEAVRQFFSETNPWYLGGVLDVMQEPIHYDFLPLRHSPSELRNLFRRMGWRRVVAYQARRPMHRAEVRMCFKASEQTSANVLVHAIANRREGAEQEHFSRIRSLQALMPRFPRGLAMLSLMPYHVRHGGARETLLSALVHQNYGCSHMVLGPEQADCDVDAMMPTVKQFKDELAIEILSMRPMVYVEDEATFKEEHLVSPDEARRTLTETQLIQRLRDDRFIPEWFSYPEVLDELRLVHRPRSRQGITVFFTGLSGSGKSTLANALMVKLMQLGNRPVTLLDGDIVRSNLSSELGFSREHRDLNIKRIGFVASEITKNGGVALCAPIAPYDEIRKSVRDTIEAVGGFILVHVATPLEECEKRDRKGLYAKARAGIIKAFTGISDPYEEPADAELVIDTTDLSQVEATQKIMLYLEQQGYISSESVG